MRDDISGQSIINTEDKNATSLCYGNCYYNNIFYSKTNKEALFTVSMMREYEFSNNLYFNVSASAPSSVNDSKAVTGVDPGFNTVTEYDGWDKVALFAPTDSRVFTLGGVFSNITPSKDDILGNDAQGIKYLGAYAKRN